MTHSSAPLSASTTRSELIEDTLIATLCATSMGAVWDLATGHAAAFDKLISNWLDDSQ